MAKTATIITTLICYYCFDGYYYYNSNDARSLIFSKSCKHLLLGSEGFLIEDFVDFILWFCSGSMLLSVNEYISITATLEYS